MPRSFSRVSPFVRLRRETDQGPDTRRPLIRKLEKRFDAKVLSFFVSFNHRHGMITDDDAEMIESILAVEHDGGRLVLVLNAPGGQALAAERIVNVCRAYSDNQFEVVVPHMAKSAATMICFGANAIHMSQTAELGPVDPQVRYKTDAGVDVWISAEEFVRSYRELIDQASNGKAKNIQPFLQQLQRYDSREIEALTSAQALSRDISVRLLKSGMMSSLTEDEIADQIDVFLSQRATSSHGRMINASGAVDCGLTVRSIDLRSAAWNELWELYVRSDWAVTHMCRKHVESASSHLEAPN